MTSKRGSIATKTPNVTTEKIKVLEIKYFYLSVRMWPPSGGGHLPPQEEEDSRGAGVPAWGVALAVLATEWSERTRLWLRPHRPEVGPDRRTLL